MSTFDFSAHPRGADGRFAPAGREESDVDLAGPDVPDATALKIPGLVSVPRPVTWVLSGLREHGMRPMLVGGSVRDALLEESSVPKDFDFEVYGAQQEDLERVLSSFGRTDTVGRQFGMTQMQVAGNDLDFSLPRRDNRTGTGHRGFEVETDPYMSFAEAARRRDFTVNAILWDPETGEVVDPMGGIADLEAGRLRACSEQFGEDPLRPLRGAQFASRFEMEMDDDTRACCRELAPSAGSLPDDRIQKEFVKLAAGRRPGLGLKALADTGWDEPLGLRGAITTDSRDAADRLAQARDGAERSVLLGAVLVRDLDPEQARAVLSRTVTGSGAQSSALALSRAEPLHADPAALRAAARGPVSIRARADLETLHGRNPGPALRLAESLGVADAPQRDLLGGRDLMSRTRARPGPWMGEVLARARRAQDEGEFGDGPDAASRARTWLDSQELPQGPASA